MSTKPIPMRSVRVTRGGFTLKQRGRSRGFTLAELLVSMAVLIIITLMLTQLMTSATAITRTAHKHIDTDTQARVVFDRMALDFAQMLKRTDVNYYVKQRAAYNGHGNGHGWGRGKNADLGSDQIAFFTAVPGYYPQTSSQSPISLVAYRVTESNSTDPAYGRLVRMAKVLLWNAVSSNPNSNSPYPIVFLPQTIALVGKPWAPAINNNNTCSGNNNSCDADYEIIGPGVFRFEYYYLLKNGYLTDWPWDRRDDTTNRYTISDPPSIGLSQVESIGVAIAVIDPAGRALLNAVSPDQIVNLAGDFPDFKSAHGQGNQSKTIGDLENQWKTIVESTAQTGRSPSGLVVPPEAAKTIRIYTRYFDLKTL